MNIRNTEAGTPIVELTGDEYSRFLEARVLGATGMTVPAFVKAYQAGKLDDADPSVAEFSVLLRMGQDGHRLGA